MTGRLQADFPAKIHWYVCIFFRDVIFITTSFLGDTKLILSVSMCTSKVQVSLFEQFMYFVVKYKKSQALFCVYYNISHIKHTLMLSRRIRSNFKNI